MTMRSRDAVASCRVSPTPRDPAGSAERSRIAPSETEREDPLNRLLDAFEEQVKALVDAGLEPQLRARLTRLLPPLVAPSDSRSASRPDGARDVAVELDLAMVVTVTKRLSRYRLAAAEHEALRRLHDWALGEIGGQNAAGPRGDAAIVASAHPAGSPEGSRMRAGEKS